MDLIRRLVTRFPVVTLFRELRGRAAMLRGAAWGEIVYAATSEDRMTSPCLEVPSPSFSGPPEGWLDGQTLPKHLLQTPSTPSSSGWFFAPGNGPPALGASWLEATLLVAASENVDAVTIFEPTDTHLFDPPHHFKDVTAQPWRSRTIFSKKAFCLRPSDDSVAPITEDILVKVISPEGIGSSPPRSQGRERHRRGPYLSSKPMPTRLTIGIRSPEGLAAADDDSQPSVLVTVPFLARGGAEHTLFATLNVLKNRCRIAYATLAPHRPELDDRRSDFATLSPHLFSLGDLVHPDAMPGMLAYLAQRHNADVLYNANSTTLFYGFSEYLKQQRPGLRVVDHLYDHEVGYINRYADPGLRSSIDACIAENNPISDALAEKFGWPKSRAPVVWPCGRSSQDLPGKSLHAAIRKRLRDELGYPEDAFVVLTAARMHEQKRPLDLVDLASRVDDVENLHFLVVGGGPLETKVDQAIAASPSGRIKRLGFRTDIPELIVAADAGMLVSQFEGLPVFMLECLQLGRPFVGTDVGDLGTVLRSTGAGFVCEPGDLDSLEHALRRTILPEEYLKLEAAATTAGAEFSPEHCAQRYAKVLFPEWPR